MTYIDEQPHIHWILKDLSHVDVANITKIRLGLGLVCG